MLEHQVRTERAGQRRLGVEARDHGDGHAPDRAPAAIATAHNPSEPAPYTSTRPDAGRRMAGDRVQRHRERIGEHRELIGHLVGHAEQHAVVRGHQLGVAAGDVGRHTGVNARFDVAVGETPAQAVIAGFTCGTQRFDPTRRARQPRVQHHSLADIQPARLRAQRDNICDDLMAHHLWKRTERGHRVVGVTLAEVEEHLLGVRPADPRQARPGDHPIIVQGNGIRHIAQSDWRVGEIAHQRVCVVGNLEWFRSNAEYQRLHDRSCAAYATAQG